VVQNLHPQVLSIPAYLEVSFVISLSSLRTIGRHP
jgi:hypothetical protein